MRAGECEQKTVYHRTILWFTETGGSEPGMWDHTVSQKKQVPSSVWPLLLQLFGITLFYLQISLHWNQRHCFARSLQGHVCKQS
jgi:hypothetical protein